MNSSPISPQYRFKFKQVDAAHRSLVHSWLRQSHVAEWFYGQGLENTLVHLDEFLNGSSEAQYWLGYDEDHPFAFFITSCVLKPGDPLIHWCAEEGEAITLDMLIGDPSYLGKGLSHTLIKEFLLSQFSQATEVLIDPEATNARAIHVYQKVGFAVLGEFIPSHSPNPHYMMRLSMDKLRTAPQVTQSHPTVIGISGISGAGKSTLLRKLENTLQATVLFWDDYDPISQGPEDYVKWYESSKNYNDWKYDDLAETLKKLKEGQTVICPATHRELHPTDYILFDAPLGYCHKATGKYIDFLVCLDTPLDIALARRLLRDHLDPAIMRQELEHYLSHSRPLYILTPEEKKSDLIIDGSLPVDKQEQIVLNALQQRMHTGKSIDIKQHPLTEELKRQLFDGFSRHAISMTGHDEKFPSLAFVAMDGDALAGAVVVERYWGTLHVKYVYIDERYRGKKLASRLMEHTFAYGRENECAFAFVETMSFQALGFYQKIGFQLEFTRPGYAHGSSLHYLRKDLDALK